MKWLCKIGWHSWFLRTDLDDEGFRLLSWRCRRCPEVEVVPS